MRHFGFLLVLVLLLSGCKSSNDVVSDGFIQKRKYNKGFYVNMKKGKHKPGKDPARVASHESEMTVLEAPEVKEIAVAELDAAPEMRAEKPRKNLKENNLPEEPVAITEINFPKVSQMPKEDIAPALWDMSQLLMKANTDLTVHLNHSTQVDLNKASSPASNALVVVLVFVLVVIILAILLVLAIVNLALS